MAVLVAEALLLVLVAVALEPEVDAPIEDPLAEDGNEVPKSARVGEINSPLAARGLEAHAWFMVSTKLPMTTLPSCSWRHRAQSAACLYRPKNPQSSNRIDRQRGVN